MFHRNNNSNNTLQDYNSDLKIGETPNPIRVWTTSSVKEQRFDSNDSTKKREKIKFVLTLICWTLSLCGFLYQTSELFFVYFSGKTVINNGVERFKSSKLPAITLCLPLFMSLQNFAQTYPEYSELCSQLQQKWDGKQLMDAFYSKNPTLGEIFNKSAIHSLDSIRVDIKTSDDQGKTIKLEENKTFRSIIPGYFPKICFTVFSDFDDKYREFKTEINEILFEFEFKMEWFSPNLSPFAFTIHSANTLPDYKFDQNFIGSSLGAYFVVKYYEIHSKLLPSPYQTNCKIYEIEGKGNKTRSDCITKCVTKRVIKECQLKDCINPKDNFQLVNEHIEQDYLSYQICNMDNLDKPTLECLEKTQLESMFYCDEVCPKNCYEIFYDMTLDRYSRNGIPPNILAIQINHDSNPDQIIEHRPIMQWLDLVSNFCGLLGMWLGLSVVFLCQYLIGLI